MQAVRAAGAGLLCAVALVATGLGGCVVRRAPVAPGPAAPTPPADLARKPGALARSPSSDANAPDHVPSAVAARFAGATPAAPATGRRGEVIVTGGWAAMDRGLDLDDGPVLGARVRRPTAWGVDAELGVKAIFTSGSGSGTRASGAPSTGPVAAGAGAEEDGAIVIVEGGLRRCLGRRATLGAAVGVAAFTGLPEEDVAPEASVSATLDLLRRGSFALGIDVQGHVLYTDVGGEDRTLRPLGVFALTASFEW
jgi:hypothetical protein